jgi:hypothetical protein
MDMAGWRSMVGRLTGKYITQGKINRDGRKTGGKFLSLPR